MTRVLITWIAFCVVLISNGCFLEKGSVVDFQPKGKIMDVVIYDYDHPGVTQSTFQVTEDSELYQVIWRYLEAKDKDWKMSYQTYAPKYEVRSATFSLNVTKSLLILNYKVNDQKWRQVIRATPDGFYSEFIEIIGKGQRPMSPDLGNVH